MPQQIHSPFELGVDETVDFLEAFLLKTPLRILDVGCGRGALAARLKILGHEVLALDQSPKAAELSRQYDIDVSVTDFIRYQSDTLFDVVLFSRSIHHMHPLNEAIHRAHALLQNKGLLVLEEFAYNWMTEPTAHWYYAMLVTLEMTNVIPPKENNATTAPTLDPYRLWYNNYEEHHVHTGEAMRDAVKQSFTVIHESKAAYLYRYAIERMRNDERNVRIARALLTSEKVLISEGVLAPLGLRLIAMKK